ncbi:MAG: hypothetical protein V3V19_11380 [Cocleimonas sp.]
MEDQSINSYLCQDTNTLANDEFESMDRVVKYKYYCVCIHDRDCHRTKNVDDPLNSPSRQMIVILDCNKCDCIKYEEGRKIEIDYSKENAGDNNIFGIDKKN